MITRRERERVDGGKYRARKSYWWPRERERERPGDPVPSAAGEDGGGGGKGGAAAIGRDSRAG